MAYIVIASPSLEQLVELVTEHMAKGYMPVGGIFVFEKYMMPHFGQALFIVR